MKINSNYKLREIAGENIIVKQGAKTLDFTRIITLNKSAKLLYEQLQGKDFELEDAASILETTYGISHEQAMSGATKWIDELREYEIME